MTIFRLAPLCPRTGNPYLPQGPGGFGGRGIQNLWSSHTISPQREYQAHRLGLMTLYPFTNRRTGLASAQRSNL